MRPEIKISDFRYELPDERIAKYPLEERDASKLLIYNKGVVSEDIFRNLPAYLDGTGMMVFNNTRVVPARLFFRKESGALIEIFCLEPLDPVEYNLSFAARSCCEWCCIAGNVKKWHQDQVLHFVNHSNDPEVGKIALRAYMTGRDGAKVHVRFEWDGDIPFSSVLEACGRIPIPPYLNRETEECDYSRYQTLYAEHRGSVAAPTAGLHFTSRVLGRIDEMGISRENVCLHVGAGTFMPVKSEYISGHSMHRERFSVSAGVIRDLIERKGDVTAVGTTSVRTLESLYYLGAHIIESGEPGSVSQWEPYEKEWEPSTEEALSAIAGYLQERGYEELVSSTGIIIVPGFRFRLVDRLVTNFHQPQSTLLLLISAFVGGDWRRIYDYALANGFRFLSYGDSSLLFRNM